MNNIFEEPIINVANIFENAELLGDIPGAEGSVGSSNFPDD